MSITTDIRCCATCDYCVEFKDEFNCCASPLCQEGPKPIPEYLLNNYLCKEYCKEYRHKFGTSKKPLMESE